MACSCKHQAVTKPAMSVQSTAPANVACLLPLLHKNKQLCTHLHAMSVMMTLS
jgi:hypothetical protein